MLRGLTPGILSSSPWSRCFIELLADEDELAGALFVLLPKPIPQDREAVVDAVEDGAARVAGDGRKPLLRKIFSFSESSCTKNSNFSTLNGRSNSKLNESMS